ncbi:MAG: SRPBCC family protein [Candidatus Rokuibacteriota bacterium]
MSRRATLQPPVTTMREAERWGSAMSGGALLVYGLRRRSLGGALLSVVGGGLVYRATLGRGPSLTRVAGPLVDRCITINRPVEDIYRFWRNFENLPRFMRHLLSVTVFDACRSHWVARAPAGRTVEWDAEIVEEVVNERIAWRAVGDADVQHTGTVTFSPVPGDRGTEVRVMLHYAPPVGRLGAALAKVFGQEPALQVAHDLKTFKQVMEAGETPSVAGQPRGARRSGR